MSLAVMSTRHNQTSTDFFNDPMTAFLAPSISFHRLVYKVCYRQIKTEKILDQLLKIGRCIVQLRKLAENPFPVDYLTYYQEANVLALGISANLSDYNTNIQQRISFILESSLFKLIKSYAEKSDCYAFYNGYEVPSKFNAYKKEYDEPSLKTEIDENLKEWMSTLICSFASERNKTTLSESILIDIGLGIFKNLEFEMSSKLFSFTYLTNLDQKKSSLLELEVGNNIKNEAPWFYLLLSLYDEKLHPWTKEFVVRSLEFFEREKTPINFISIKSEIDNEFQNLITPTEEEIQEIANIIRDILEFRNCHVVCTIWKKEFDIIELFHYLRTNDENLLKSKIPELYQFLELYSPQLKSEINLFIIAQ